MRPLVLAVLVLFALTAMADDLVTTAKEAKAKRRKSTTKVIRNADVKKSKARIATTGVPETLPPTEPSLLAVAAATREAERIRAERTLAAKALVGSLEKELAAIEQRYYDETDLDRRDSEIVRRFNETKTKLDAARSDLSVLSAKPGE
ncbi:MAG: hypothetical protein ABI779_16750 [Acidobacteriota bacterium]